MPRPALVLAVPLAVLACPACRCARGGPQPPDVEPIDLVFVGDVMPARGVEQAARRAAGERWADYIFEHVAATVREADLAFANLEVPISAGGKRVEGKRITMRAAPETAAAIARAGFDVVSLANNHILDYGPEAAADTVRAVREAGMTPVGFGRGERQQAAIVEAGGLKLGFLAYTYTYPRQFQANEGGPFAARAEAVSRDVRAARRRAHHVIVSVHGGREYSLRPAPAQRKLADAALSSGATLVVMHHAHTPQPLEFHPARGTAVAYGLGNFVFDLNIPWKRYRVRRSVLMRARLGRRLRQAVYEPIEADAHHRPRPGGTLDAASLMARYRPPGHLVWDLETAVQRAQVTRTREGGTERCPRWVEDSVMGETSLGGYWMCPGGLGRAVGRSADLSAGVYRTVVRMEPRPDSAVGLRFPRVPGNGTLVGFAGLSDWSAEERGASEVRIDLSHAGRALGTVRVENRPGWQPFRFPLGGGAGPLEVHASVERGERRHLGIGAWVVRSE